jgi:transketolase
MDVLAPQTPGITAGSADLTDNTGVILKHSSPQNADIPAAARSTSASVSTAWGPTWSARPITGAFDRSGSTFFVFSDYERPAIRLAALSDASVLFVFTHDSVGVGQDGPTHQPIEHLMALRAMPRLHVVRPSDANETLDLVEDVSERQRPPPTALILSRQDMAVFGGDDALASQRACISWRLRAARA